MLISRQKTLACSFVLASGMALTYNVRANSLAIHNVFNHASTMSKTSKPTSVIVFSGDHRRVCKGYSLLKTLPATAHLYVSGHRDHYRKHGLRCGDDFLSKSMSNITFAAAVNTHDNGLKSAVWLTEKNHKETYLVTSDFHMKRSILELKNAGYTGAITPIETKSDFEYKENWAETVKYWVRLAGIPTTARYQIPYL